MQSSSYQAGNPIPFAQQRHHPEVIQRHFSRILMNRYAAGSLQ